MYKAICAVLAAVSVLALVYGTRSAGATPSGLSTAQIVASGQVLNQTAGFSQTIFTPTVSGLYRLSAYAEITTPAPNTTQSCWLYGFNWTDSSGGGSSQPLTAIDFQKGSFLQPFQGGICGETAFGIYSGFTETFQARKGTPITHSMQQGGPADGSAFSLYYTLERIH